MTIELALQRLPVRLTRDPRQTITRFFWLGPGRARKIIQRVLALEEEETVQLLLTTLQNFDHLHIDLMGIFLAHFEEVRRRVGVPDSLSDERKRLLGAFFTLEYSFASAALFNPSIAPAINQQGVEPGSLRFVMSLRCVGEGHISSIVFRRGIVNPEGQVVLERAGPYREPRRWIEKRLLSKPEARSRLRAVGVREPVLEEVFGHLGNPFTMEDLRAVTYRVQATTQAVTITDEDIRLMESLVPCDYNVEMFPDTSMNQVILFPMCQAESRGMEDMRLVRFAGEDGSLRYYGTYTAFNGWWTRVQLVEISTPEVAYVRSLRGRAATNKGLALFPRQVGGRYVMSGRIDGENLYILQSKDIRVWDEAVLVQEPESPWEIVQIGNCGSPIETEAGWLLLTHGVGPMRRYCIGATLLDLDDPTKLIGRLDRPLVAPTDEERTGYVPNVVYSCGALVHNGMLVIPYGISDAATGFATIPLDDLLSRLT